MTAHYREEATTRRVLDAITCNRCGVRVEKVDGMLNCFAVEHKWGFLSNKDWDIDRWHLCEKCYDAVVETFKVPIDRVEVI